jgi:hypothetical protein
MNKQMFIDKCNKGNHELIEIYRSDVDIILGVQDIVRWCNICGAVVIDREIDGRLIPGEVLKMMGPLVYGEIQ